MSEYSAGYWIPIGPSALKRRWLCAAAALCACLAVTLYAKAFSAGAPILLFAAATANGCAAAWLVGHARVLRTAVKPGAVRIDGQGAIWLRDVPVACRPVYVSSVLVVVKAPARSVALWCDALDPDGFRKVVVAVRWAERVAKLDLDAVGQKTA